MKKPNLVLVVILASFIPFIGYETFYYAGLILCAYDINNLQKHVVENRMHVDEFESYLIELRDRCLQYVDD